MIDPRTIDEASRRRPTFTAGEPIRLRDGHAWTFLTPHVVTAAEINDRGRPILIPKLTFGAEAGSVDSQYEDLLFDIGSMQSKPSAVYFAENVVPMAAILLGLNYDLTPDECRALLIPHAGDDAWVFTIMMAALLTVTTVRPLEALQRAQARLPYRDIDQCHTFNITIN
jgi:hypothetical protein